MQVTPYLYFKGACESALKFSESCGLGGVFANSSDEGAPVAERTGDSAWRERCCYVFLKAQDFGCAPPTGLTRNP